MRNTCAIMIMFRMRDVRHKPPANDNLDYNSELQQHKSQRAKDSRQWVALRDIIP